MHLIVPEFSSSIRMGVISAGICGKILSSNSMNSIWLDLNCYLIIGQKDYHPWDVTLITRY